VDEFDVCQRRMPCVCVWIGEGGNKNPDLKALSLLHPSEAEAVEAVATRIQ